MMGKKKTFFTDRKKILNESQKQKGKKDFQGIDIPIKIIKDNTNVITDSMYNNLNIWTVHIFIKFEKCWYNTCFLKQGLWKRCKLPPCKHPSSSIKSLWKVHIWSNIYILNQDSV